MRALAGLLVLAIASPALAQTPQPFPNPAGTQPTRPAPSAPPPAPAPPPQTSAPAPRPSAPATQAGSAGATAAAPNLGEIPLYPNAVYLTSYDAGRGQRFHLYGVLLPYPDAVAFYRSALKQRGDELFLSPPTHQFETGRYRDSEMAFPPSVTIKDYTWGGSAGYLNPRPGAQPERFPTVIQIVLPPSAQ